MVCLSEALSTFDLLAFRLKVLVAPNCGDHCSLCIDEMRDVIFHHQLAFLRGDLVDAIELGFRNQYSQLEYWSLVLVGNTDPSELSGIL